MLTKLSIIMVLVIITVLTASARINSLEGDMGNSSNTSDYETATLGGGCFWCLEPIFESVKGVTKAESGFAGGHVANPTYKEVCTGETGHAEVVQVTFDPGVISYQEILEIFFSIHDPTTLNRQGADVGTQYRSAIFTHSDEQEKTAKDVIRILEKEGTWKDPIVTEVAAHTQFYKAEDYHQEYYANNPNQAYCRLVISPKVNKFRKNFEDALK